MQLHEQIGFVSNEVLMDEMKKRCSNGQIIALIYPDDEIVFKSVNDDDFEENVN